MQSRSAPKSSSEYCTSTLPRYREHSTRPYARRQFENRPSGTFARRVTGIGCGKGQRESVDPRGTGLKVTSRGEPPHSSTFGEQDHRRLYAIWVLSVPMRPRPTNAAGRNFEPGVVKRNGAPERTYQLRCVCSYKVRCEVMRHRERLGELTFFDDEEVSVTQGERVWYRTGCHNRLGLLSLGPRGWTTTQMEPGRGGRRS
jgi:hypothetical protein